MVLIWVTRALLAMVMAVRRRFMVLVLGHHMNHEAFHTTKKVFLCRFIFLHNQLNLSSVFLVSQATMVVEKRKQVIQHYSIV